MTTITDGEGWMQRAQWRGGQKSRRALGGCVMALALGSWGCDAMVDPSFEGDPLISITGRIESPLSVQEDIEIGILWLRTTEPITVVRGCELELSGETPSACVAACGVPSCAEPAKLRFWERCAEQCEGPRGVSYLWIGDETDAQIAGAVGQTVSVEGEFPAQFRLDVLEPPADDVLIRSRSGEAIGVGLFVALDPVGAPFQITGNLPGLPPWVRGGSESHLVLFAPEALQAGSDWRKLLDGYGLPAGFQLMEVIHEQSVDEAGKTQETVDYVPVPASEATQVRLRVDDTANIRWPLLSP
jgi:hypothetical protein